MRKYLVFIFCLIGILTLSACTGTQETKNDSPKQEKSTGTNEKVSTNGELTYLATQAIATIDPGKHTDESSMQIIINTYDPLLYPKVSEDSMDPGPHIAKEWTISDDAKVYTFNLQEGVVFHSGNPLTADDVVYSFKRMLSLQQGYSWLWNGILDSENVKKVDNLRVEITLNQPYAPFLSTLTQLFILDSKLVQENKVDGEFGEMGDYGQAFVQDNNAGSGPYIIEGWQRGSEMKLAQFTDYWRGWKDGQVEKVKYMTVPEEATQKTMLRSGEAQMVNQWMSIESQKQLSQENTIGIAEDPSSQLYHITMHTQKAPLDDINVRKAISYAFDYKTTNEQILQGAEQAQGPVPLLVPGHSKDAVIYQQDLEKAKEYMAKSKYSGQQLKIQYYYVSDIEAERKTGLLLQNNLKPLGIEVELVGVPWTQVTEITAKLETTPHMTAVYDTLKYPHIDSHTYGLYHPSSQGSYRSASWYENEKVTELLEKARKEIDVDKQREYYKEVQNIVTEDAVSLFIANPTHRVVYREEMKGYNFVGLLGYDTAFYDFTLE